MRYNGIVHLKQQPQAIPLARQFLLKRCRSLMVKSVLHRNGDLAGYHGHKLDLMSAVRVLSVEPNTRLPSRRGSVNSGSTP